MRELHVVAVSDDGRHVLLAGKRGATSGGFRVALDERLLAAVRGDLPRPGEDPHAASELTPKEIQARLRAGESAESIAASAGVPVLRVERFSGPVQGEMARMIEAARSAYLVRGRLGRSAVPLGAAVDQALLQTPSLQAESVEWQTRRDAEGCWVVTVSWFARARTRSASWSYDPVAKAVTAVDAASAALGHREADQPVAAPRRRASAAPAAPKAPVKKTRVTKAVTTKASVKKARVTPTAPKAPVKKARVTKARVTKAVTTKAPVKKPAVTKAPVRKAAVTKGPVKKAAAPVGRSARVSTRQARTTRTLRVVPDPEPRRRATKAAAERDGVKTRATVPGWADVLLGTSPGGDR